MVEVRQHIRRLRQQKGMTTVELGDLVGITGASISRIEGGKQNITLDVLARIALALDVRMADLLDEHESVVYAYVRGYINEDAGLGIAYAPGLDPKGYANVIPLPLKSPPGGTAYQAFITKKGFLVAQERRFPDKDDLCQPFVILWDFAGTKFLLRGDFKASETGFGFTIANRDPSRYWTRADDPKISKLWRVVAEIRYYGPNPFIEFTPSELPPPGN